MVGGGGKKNKGKSTTAAPNANPPAPVANVAPTPGPKVNNVATPAAAPLVNKESQQPPPSDADTQIKTSDDSALDSDGNRGNALNLAPASIMEPPVVSAANPGAKTAPIATQNPPKSLWENPDSIKEFVPKSLPSEPVLPSAPVAAPPAPAPLMSSNGPAGMHPSQVMDKSWTPNISANSFVPTAPYGPPPFQPVPAPLMYQPGPSMLSYRMSPGPSYFMQPIYPSAPGPQPSQKHMLPRAGPPGSNYEPTMPYGVDVHVQHKQEPVQINLNSKKPTPFSPYTSPATTYTLIDQGPYAMQVPVSNSVQVVPKPQVPREPVNVSAANLSNEPPAVTKTNSHPPIVKEKPRPPVETVVQQPKPVAELKINSVMKVEEEEAEEVKEEKVESPVKEIPTEPTHVEKKKTPPPVDKSVESSQVKEKPAPAPVVEKSRVSPPSGVAKKEASPPAVVEKKVEDKKSVPAPKEVQEKSEKQDKVDGIASSKAADSKPTPIRVEQRQKPVENQTSKSEPAKTEVSKPSDETREVPSALSHKEKEVETPAVLKPVEAASKPGGPSGFNFNSFTNLSSVTKINDADKFRESMKQRSLNRNAEEEENSDPNRKKYSRDQLMELKNKPASIKCPEGLDKSNPVFSQGGGKSGSDNFSRMSDFKGSGGGSYRSASQHYRDRDQPSMIYHSVSLKAEVKLKTAENAWKPQALKKDPIERIVMDAKSLLNKLSPENFDSIIKKFLQLQINDENISKIIDVIMFKAIWEPKFAEVYARFIEGIKNYTVAEKKKRGKPDKDKEHEPADRLTDLLMKKCGLEFEGIVKSEGESKIKLEAIKKIADEKEREEARVAFEEEEMLGRKKSVGVMTFIGELFKLKLLHPRILHGCFHQLLSRGNDVESLECLAKLITSTGKSVELLNSGSNEHASASKKHWDTVLTGVNKLVSEKNKNKIPSRIRFMFLDVLDLKARNWVPRMVENKPKTMAQIDKDLETEAMRRSVQMRDDDRNPPQSKVGNKKPQPGPQTPSQQPSFQKIDRIDTDKFKALTQDMELSLRPMMPSFMNAALGASGASGFKSAQSKTRGGLSMSSPAPPAPIVHKNSFSALSMPDQTPVVDKPKPTPVSNAIKTPQKSKQPPPIVNRFDNAAFEKLLAADSEVKNNYDIEDKYFEFLTFGKHFSDKQDFKGNNNQYREEVNILIARCLVHLNEPMLSVARLEKLYLKFVDKIEKEVNSLGKEKFDPCGLTRSLLLDLLTKRPADHIFVTSLLISIIDKHKKWGSCLELMKDFVIYCTKSDIRDDYPNVIKVLGEVIGYLIGFRTLTIADYKKQLLIKYAENVSSPMFVHMVKSIGRLQGSHVLHESIPTEESLKEYLSPLLYRTYQNSKDFDSLDLKQKLGRYKLGFLLDKSIDEQPCRVTSDDHLGVMNACLHYFVSSKSQAASDYLSLNFALSSPGVAADVYFTLTQKICYESLEPQGSGDDDVVTYKLNEARFKELYRTLVVSTLQSLDNVLPSLYSILDVNLHLQLPGGLLLSQFVAVKELLVDSPLGSNLLTVNAPFKRFAEDKSLYHVPSSALATVLSKEQVVQESGFSKTSALPSLKNFYNSIEEEEEESEGEPEEGEK